MDFYVEVSFCILSGRKYEKASKSRCFESISVQTIQCSYHKCISLYISKRHSDMEETLKVSKNHKWFVEQNSNSWKRGECQ